MKEYNYVCSLCKRNLFELGVSTKYILLSTYNDSKNYFLRFHMDCWKDYVGEDWFEEMQEDVIK